MFSSIARAVFGSANDRSLKAYQRRVPEINAHEPAMAALSDAALQGKTAEFRERLAAVRRSTPCCPRPMRWCGRRRSACWASGISTCS